MRRLSLVTLLLIAGMAGSARAADPAVMNELRALRQEVEALKRGQQELKDLILQLTKEKPARAAPPRGPAPEKVYAFPTGRSPAQGPADAWVTLVAVLDFQ